MSCVQLLLMSTAHIKPQQGRPDRGNQLPEGKLTECKLPKVEDGQDTISGQHSPATGPTSTRRANSPQEELQHSQDAQPQTASPARNLPINTSQDASLAEPPATKLLSKFRMAMAESLIKA